MTTEAKSHSSEVAETVCKHHGHSLIRFSNDSETLCAKCGMSLADIRADRAPSATYSAAA